MAVGFPGMVWLSNRRDTQRPRTADPVAPAETRGAVDTPNAKPAFRESTPRAFAIRLAVMLALAAITPGFHLRSLATLSAAAGVVVAYGAVCARDRLDTSHFTAWDEAVAFLAIAWLAFRLF
ncbi:MAG: hypothetical protein JO021_20390 [Alphaproteobacteria bacterium]|nr:hypothetical protein [Alphaproteobacteria bacterium]